MDILSSLAPKRYVRTENVVDGTSPAVIADDYMESKINSIRTAKLRGYKVEDWELDLVQQLTTSSRKTAHTLFIQRYISSGYLTVSALTSVYDWDNSSPLVVAEENHPQLAFVFYTANGVDSDEVKDLVDGSELVLIGLSPLANIYMKPLVEGLNKKNVTIVNRVTQSMAMWPVYNHMVPEMVLHKNGYQLEELSQQLKLKSMEKLTKVKVDDLVAKIYGVEEGDGTSGRCVACLCI